MTSYIIFNLFQSGVVKLRLSNMLTAGILSLLLGAATALPQTSIRTEDGFTSRQHSLANPNSAPQHANNILIVYQNIPARRQAPPEAPAPGAPTAAPVVIPVVVGGVQVTYMPNVVVAAPGNIVQFQFSAGNHTVTQSTEMQTCTPMEAVAGQPDPVHSGHIPFTAGSQNVSTFEMMVINTNPMFIYCATGPHCQLGQVMVINPYVVLLSCPRPRPRNLSSFANGMLAYTGSAQHKSRPTQDGAVRRPRPLTAPR